MYLTRLGIRIQRGTFHIYFKKCFFWILKDCEPPLPKAKTTFSSSLNVMMLQMVKKRGRIDLKIAKKRWQGSSLEFVILNAVAWHATNGRPKLSLCKIFLLLLAHIFLHMCQLLLVGFNTCPPCPNFS
jgi:hypothetical protein